MISMVTKQEIIIRYFREGDSLRKISRDLKISRPTIKKYLQEYIQRQASSDNSTGSEAFHDYLTSPPGYNSSKREKRRLTTEISQHIDLWLEENEKKRASGNRKLCLKKRDIHEQLQEQGYQIGYTTVCNYVSSKQRKQKEAFIRQEYLAAESCEFDWAEIRLEVQGKEKRYYLAVFTSSYSNYRFALLYNRQDTLAFMESHVAFFAHVQGVFQEMVYDNMRVAVAQFIGRNEKEPTTALLQLSGWYHYRFRFCNVRRGNEKGHVERSVEYVRRKAFGVNNAFSSFEQAKAHLSVVCERLNSYKASGKQQSIQQLFEQEKPALWQWPGDMACFMMQTSRVDKYSTISVGTNHYSVPEHLVGKMLEIKLYANHLKCYHEKQVVANHERSYLMHGWHIQLEHYLETLRRKPGALRGSVALQQSEQFIKSLYRDYFLYETKAFLELLQYCQKYQIPAEELARTVAALQQHCPKDISVEKLMALLGNKACYVVVETQGEIERSSQQQLSELTSLLQS